jgi:ferrochelatase
MPRYAPEPAPNHGAPRRTAVLLVNLGTPEAPTAAALRPYLKQFLWDPRVVEIPRPVWWLILNGIILNTCARQIGGQVRQDLDGRRFAAQGTYRAPGQAAQGLAGRGRHPDLDVAWAMRYGQPSIAGVLDRSSAMASSACWWCRLYPQFAASSTASVMDDVADWIKRSRNPLEIPLHQALPRPPRLHRSAGRQRARTLGATAGPTSW